jgi:hypothetical protein
VAIIIDTGGQIYKLLNTIITQQNLQIQQGNQLMALSDDLKTADAALQASVAALVPLINTAIGMLTTLASGGSVPDAEVTQVINDMNTMASALAGASSSLTTAEAPAAMPPAAPATPAATPSP